ncbi:MAG TPA: nucleoside-triphosphatase [Ktedonobacteraceae bacterium]|nr:nucleoside-triphosphatase [Ktedonobacteraceae bacterium]
MSKAYFLTGNRRVGKTTTIRRLIDAVGIERCGGFCTEEIRVQDIRTGFRLVTLDGQSGLFAYMNSQSPLRIGRYGIHLDCLETIGLEALYKAMAIKNLIVLDEIGPMELYSHRFKRAVIDALNAPRPFLSTIALKSLPWLDTLKQGREIELYTLTPENRNTLVDTLTHALNITLNEASI